MRSSQFFSSRICVLLLCVTTLTACTTRGKAELINPTIPPGPTLSHELTTQGILTDNRLNEVSGLAVSTRRADRLWALNDSGNSATLFALNTRGQVTGTWPVTAKNRDWEALASMQRNGDSWLLIADTGDNLQQYSESFIHIVQEPDERSSAGASLVPTLSLRFRFEDGSQNVEAMGVSDNTILLLTKAQLQADGGQRSIVYQLPLSLTPTNRLLVAKRQGELQLPERGLAIQLITKLLNIDPLQPTDLVIAPNNTDAWVLNYRQILRYQRSGEESWANAFSKAPISTRIHSLKQAESITADAYGGVWITSEKTEAPLQAFKSIQPNKASRVSP